MSSGAYIRISNGNIEVTAPKTTSIRGKDIPLSGPTKIGVNMQAMPSADLHCLTFIIQDRQGNIQKNTPYIITDGTGQTLKGVTDKKGRTQQIHTSTPNDLTVSLDHSAMGNPLE